MERKHTPGPWEITSINGWDGVTSKRDGDICKLVYNNPENARLIAAAPDLLEALKEMLRCGQKQGWQDKYEKAMKRAGAAIKKAEKGV